MLLQCRTTEEKHTHTSWLGNPSFDKFETRNFRVCEILSKKKILKSNKNKLVKHTFTARVYANLFTDNLATENAPEFKSVCCILFSEKGYLYCPIKKVLKLNKMCNHGNEIKLNKTNTRLTLFIVCGSRTREHFH